MNMRAMRILRLVAAGTAFCLAFFPLVVVHSQVIITGWPLLFSRRIFTEYRFDVVVAGGAFDQSGLTKVLVIVLALEFLVAFSWLMCRLISSQRTWRIVHTAALLPAFVLPGALSVLFTWELSRYVAVMGITENRVIAMGFAILIFFFPMFCAVKWTVGEVAWAKIWRMAGLCLAAAIAVVIGINAIARWSVASHPRPTICLPNRVAVPSA